MKDEEYLYYQDVKEKKITGYSARKARTHCGKGGRVRLPSDYLSKKELKNMSGECKSYRLNEPMKWAEFKDMPDDIQKIYITALREKYNVPDAQLARMFGTCQSNCATFLKKKGISRQRHHGKEEWDSDGFLVWAYGAPLAKMGEEQPAEAVEEAPAVEDDLPWNAPEEEAPAPVQRPVTLTRLVAVPESGTMSFSGNATQIMNTLVNLFGGAKIRVNVNWDMLED